MFLFYSYLKSSLSLFRELIFRRTNFREKILKEMPVRGIALILIVVIVLKVSSEQNL